MTPPPGGPLPLRRNRDFVLLQTGRLLSGAGTSTATIAYPLLVLAVTHSPAQAGLVSFARLAPYVVFGLAAGVAADRGNRKRLMVAADVVRALAVGSLVVAIALGRVSIWHILGVAFVEGAAAVFFGAAETGAFRSVVPKAQLAAAASTEQARLSVVRLAGPPVGGALFGLGRAVPFAADAVSYAFSTASLLAMRTPFQEERERDHAPLRAQLAEGLRFLRTMPFLRTAVLMISVGNVSVSGVQLAVIVLAKRHGLSGAATGAFVGLVGATTLLGSVASPLLRRVLSLRAILLSEFWAALALLGFLVWPSVYVLASALAFQAFFFPNTDSALTVYRLALTPDRLTGRVATAITTLAAFTMPLGPLAAGVLLDSTSPRAAMAVFSATALALAVWGTLSRSIRGVPPLEELTRPEASPAAAG